MPYNGIIWLCVNYTEPQVYGIALLSGFGGARILNSLLESQIARFEREQLADVAVNAIEALEVATASETDHSIDGESAKT